MKVLFLPGAGGAASFWHSVGDRLPAHWEKVYLAWPGLGDEPPDESVCGFDDCVRLVERHLDRECVLIAQSMGGIVAMKVAAKHPRLVRRLVLVATSGGIDVASLGGADWRTAYRTNYPDSARWITDERPDHTADAKRLPMPTLLLWGDEDPISPVAVGEHLLGLLPYASLHVIKGGKHSLGQDHPDQVARLVVEHLRTDEIDNEVRLTDDVVGKLP